MMTDSDPATRSSLIAKLEQPHEAEAWFEFVEIYQPLILDLCRRRGLQPADAADVSQDVMARVARNVQGYSREESGATFRGWLYCITRNLIYDRFRKARNDVIAGIGPDGLSSVISPEISVDDSKEFQAEFRKRVFLLAAQIVSQQVRSSTWKAFWRTEVEGESPQTVADSLGMSRGALYVAKSRVLARLRAEAVKRLEDPSQFFSDETKGLEG